MELSRQIKGHNFEVVNKKNVEFFVKEYKNYKIFILCSFVVNAYVKILLCYFPNVKCNKIRIHFFLNSQSNVNLSSSILMYHH